ncbi:hypothetical protein Cgig2_000140 [Carnegiea gigantea]|uniref:Reverse transcriptase zinc-binding domain-containing protein n=1 Tax=Carnegiea gigantea TaxID=171969 RepID=A0A9Q1QT38_9CARY|nr:hypothetical protein Cgig2_000140 [Carnegiea gigantea]
MWITDPSCTNVISFAWTSIAKVNVVDNLLERLDACATKLQQWNQEAFGHLGREITQLEQKLKTQPDALTEEEIMWWQQARSNYLKYNDLNTRWFHSRANMRRARNHINHLVDEQGIKHTKIEDIEDIITDDPLRPGIVMGFLDPPCLCNPYRASMCLMATGQINMALSSRWIFLGALGLPYDREDLALGCRRIILCPAKRVKTIWSLCLPPRIKLFTWRICKGILPINSNLARRMPSWNMNCPICGHYEESDTQPYWSAP